MRAGLLSDPRVVALLRTRFIPCMVSALNTPQCFRDPRDAATLERYVRPGLDDFDGGEREAFVLPDGKMLGVFLSLRGDQEGGPDVHYTREGRRSESAVNLFRRHGEAALRRVDGKLPDDWDAMWAGENDFVRSLAETPPAWPVPEACGGALRVFVRNSYRMYDDLSGCELVEVEPAATAEWLAGADEPGAVARLPQPVFRALVRAMAPRGQVATDLADESIEGEIEFHVEAVEDGVLRGRITGCYAMRPKALAEVGARRNAACLFESSGRFVGRFGTDRTGALAELRLVTTAVDMRWKPSHGGRPTDFPPHHRVAIEWVRRP